MLYTTSLIGGKAIIVGSDGAAYVTGTAFLSGYYAASEPLTGVPGARDVSGNQCVYDTITVSGNPCTFVAKLSVDGKTVLWGALLGGTGTQTPHAIAMDPNSGVLYLAGETTATDLPVTAGAVQPALHGQSDGFLASVKSDGSAFGFVTYLGGSANDETYGLAVAPDGSLVVAGDTISQDFPVMHAVQQAFGGGPAVHCLSPPIRGTRGQ